MAVVPGPKPMPLLGWRGNALRFFGNPVKYMMRLFHDHGPVARLAEGFSRPLFFASDQPEIASFFALDPDSAKAVLNDTKTFQTRRPPGPNFPTYHRLSTNILFINGDRHRQQKTLMRPWFDRAHIQSYYADMVASTQRMLEEWEDREEIELMGEMSRLTLGISSETLYGLKSHHGERHLAGMMAQMIRSLFSPAALVQVNLPGTPYSRLLKLMARIEEVLLIEVERKRREGCVGKDILSAMVKAHDETPGELSADELLGEAFTLFFAGHDTASKALVWTLFLIAQHPKVAAELQEEVDGELQGEPPSYGRIFRLAVLDRVIKESLRVMPPAVVFPRVATVPTTLGGFEIAAGSEVLYSPYVIHKTAPIYPQPNRFDPDRWRSIKPKAFEYMPFGAGARLCLGASFGMIQLRVIIALILQRYRLSVVEGTRIDLDTNVVIGPKGPMPMRITPQDHRFEDSPARVGGYIREMVDLAD
ncbi:MAG: cytochrome P450 [Acidobacteriota bacterium]